MLDVIIPEQGDHAKLWINDEWVRFNVEYGTYDNFIIFLDHHDLSFIKTNYIDCDALYILDPPLHGFGHSYSLMQYLANNAGNESLICDFIDYYISILDFRYYYMDHKLDLKYYCNDNWQISNIIVKRSVPYNNLTVDSIMWRVDTIEISADQIYI